MATELRQPPLDWISNVTYAPVDSRNILAVSSWDKHFRLYDTDANSILAIHDLGSPILDCTFAGDSSKILLGGLNKNVTLYDANVGMTTILGKHDEPIRSIRYHPGNKLIYSGGWDNSIRVWDPRNRSQQPITVAKLSGKCFCMDISANELVAADSFKRIYIFNIRNAATGLQQTEYRDQILKFQMRTLRCFPNDKGFAVASIEGRVAWELFDTSPEAQTEKFTFKCHRSKGDDGVEIAYPVNALAFHPLFGTFVTGGADGGVSVWDGLNRKRLWRLPSSRAAISSAAFDPNGTQLAVAVSDTSCEGQPIKSNPHIMCRPIKAEDVKPKAWQNN